MIIDQETNFVYFSELFSKNFEKEYTEITSILNKFKVGNSLLKETKDIWCRDYMPIQVSSNKFIEYRYDPDYLQAKKYRTIKTYPDMVCNSINLKTEKSDLIIDGGNVIKSKKSIILTNKIEFENKDSYNPNQLRKKLLDTFGVNQIIIIPWDKENEIFGHADGMIRFINEDTVLLNGFYREKEYSKKFQENLFGALEKAKLKYIELKFEKKNANQKLNWGYINFLWTKNVIILPQFGIGEDIQAVEQFEKIFPRYAKENRIEKVNASRIIEKGGVLNCMTWNIKK